MFGGRKKVPDRLQQVVKAQAERAVKVHKQNRRASVRSNTFAQCSLTSQSGYTVSGIVIDTSPTGVRVRFRHHYRLNRFVLVKASRLHINRRAEVVWQFGSDAGLKFV